MTSTQLPLVSMLPSSTWAPPTAFPDLSSAKMIAVDCETRDDEIKTKGPGVRRGSYIVGVAVATDDGFKGYYPIAHDEGPNLNPDAVLDWLATELARPNQPKVGANLLYDLDYLAWVGVEAAGPFYDVENAEPLIDEYRDGGYSLNALAKKYLGEGKPKSRLEEACKDRGLKGDPRQHIWRLPATEVGEYAEGDVELPLLVFAAQRQILEAESLWDAFILETRIVPVLLAMRRIGIRIDEPRLEETEDACAKKLTELKEKLDHEAGVSVDMWAEDSVRKVLDRFGIAYKHTKTKKASITKEWLESLDHPFAKALVKARAMDRFVGTFLKGAIREYLIDGRLHTEFNQSKSDDRGTVTGRFSSSNPGLQLVPGRDETLGPLARSLFIPEPGCDMGAADYSQIQFRIFIHYALGPGSEEFRARYRGNPALNFHAWCAEAAGGVDYHAAKTVDLALLFGAGLKTTAVQLGKPVDETAEFLQKYHNALPFLKATQREFTNRAAARGWVKSMLGGRARFHLWEARDRGLAGRFQPSRDKDGLQQMVETAIKEAVDEGHTPPTPGVQRAWVHKAMNRVIQRTEAEIIKTAMARAFEDGLLNTLTFHLVEHDELVVSVPRTNNGREAWDELGRIMEGAAELRVPLLVERGLGANWWEAK